MAGKQTVLDNVIFSSKDGLSDCSSVSGSGLTFSSNSDFALVFIDCGSGEQRDTNSPRNSEVHDNSSSDGVVVDLNENIITGFIATLLLTHKYLLFSEAVQ